MNIINKIICNDCLKVFKDIEDKSINLCIIDPPYNINYYGRGKITKFTAIKGDNVDVDEHNKWLTKIIEQIYRILKDDSSIYVFVDYRNYPRFYNIIKRYFNIKNCIVWDKCSIGMGQSYRFQHEFIIYAVKGKLMLNFLKRNVSDIIRIKRDNVYFHPTQKPVELLEKLILYSSNVNDIVFDCFAGSGSTLVASKKNDRNFIGIEIEEKYCNIIKKRLDNIQAKLL